MKNICFIDFETTGTNVFVDEPIEIGAILIDHNFNEINRFYSKINPNSNVKISESAFNIHSYKLSDLTEAPATDIVINGFFREFRFDYYFAGWNISFDVPFFRKMCYSSGRLEDYNKIDYRHLDVQSIVKFLVYLRLLPTNLESLSSCADYFEISRSKKHNALEDAEITLNIFKKIIKRFYSINK